MRCFRLMNKKTLKIDMYNSETGNVWTLESLLDHLKEEQRAGTDINRFEILEIQDDPIEFLKEEKDKED